MQNIAIVLGSTRPGRNGEAVANWVLEATGRRTDVTRARFELVDVKAFALPLLDEPSPASAGKPYSQAHTRRWSAAISAFDAFLFVTPEYNHGLCPALKNALDFLYSEWNHKAAGFVSYGGAGGVRSVEQLRQVMGALMITDVSRQVSLSLFTDFEAMRTFKPDPRQERALHEMIDEVISAGEALVTLRANTARKTA